MPPLTADDAQAATGFGLDPIRATALNWERLVQLLQLIVSIIHSGGTLREADHARLLSLGVDPQVVRAFDWSKWLTFAAWIISVLQKLPPLP